MDQQRRIEAVSGILASLFASQRSLKALAPQYGWSGLGNLLGDFGEFLAAEIYGLTPAAKGANGYDAITPDGHTVQVKTNFAASMIGFRGEADLLLCLRINAAGQHEELYYGPFEPVKALARYSARDNKHTVTLSQLAKLKGASVSPEPAISLPTQSGQLGEPPASEMPP
jgi:hypothetical protein